MQDSIWNDHVTTIHAETSTSNIIHCTTLLIASLQYPSLGQRTKDPGKDQELRNQRNSRRKMPSNPVVLLCRSEIQVRCFAGWLHHQLVWLI
jgi:hypothetical protein